MTLLIGLAALFAYFASDLPDSSELWREGATPKITLLSADGSPIMRQGVSQGAPIRLADLPLHVPDAVLAVEDRNFYHHFGANPVSILRALIVNVTRGEVRQGGSTITQQLAKNVFLTGDQTIKRKIQELMLAVWLERKFTKQEILTLYLNRVYFGAGAYGVDAASYRYFGKSAKHLSLGEAAVLAGLLKAPSRYAPTNNPDDAGKRGRLVIEQMVEAGFLTREQADRVIADPVLLASPRFEAAPYFVDQVLRETRKITGDLDADLFVFTTFDPKVQAAAETGLIAGAAMAGSEMDEVEAAAVFLDGEGAVRAMIGGRDYAKSQFNRAAQAQRQPGSAFKPIVYLASLSNGKSPDAMVVDAPVTIGTWAPGNYKDKYYGDVSMREALALSLNSAAVRVQEETGRQSVRDIARQLGWKGNLETGPSLALGVDEISPMGLAGVYAPFANGGLQIEPHLVERIETADGDLVYARKGAVVGEVADAEAIAELNEMLEAVVTWGTGRAAKVPGYRTVGKTGTSQDSRDAWFAGHAGGLVGVVWIGRDDNKPMNNVTGGRAPAIIWREMMARALPPPSYVAPVIDEDPIAAILQMDG
ncbi:PBP1A family penicillin-binding protein [Hyphococcus flavus]|uniref:PBP1A family penicillin-binding protein n=1 Tax=Hyphococcus flavus TaxID=1866326 RepID=A0AAE9ZES0_9PROT|nr:PBP1A family penicillin-binding protein [Hyphococcus flavus]WDI32420.1 PBP1A family penicillin-binding protein [Hyphococcus flavus]